MRARDNEMTITRGESFTMSKLIQNRDGSPYIVSSRLKNPYWLISVASSRYEQKDRQLLRKWLSLENFPRFEYTRPVNIADYGMSFSDDTLPFLDVNNDDHNDFTGDETSGYSNVAVFYEKDGKGVISYKYWEYINNIEGNFDGRWVSYNCPIVTAFTRDVTIDFAEQNYYYSIDLVCGEVQPDIEEPIRIDHSFPILLPTLLAVNSNL